MLASATHGAHILLIDDNLDDVTPLVRLLHSADMKVSQTASPRQGYQRALALNPDLVVLDLHMPGMDGFTICRLLREAPTTKNLPVIFLSSASRLEDRLTGFQLGGVDYVVKPYTPEEVLARIKVHLRLRQNQKITDQPFEANLPTNEEELILQASTRLLLDNLNNPPSLVELSRSVGTHEKRLLKIFRDRMGMTVFAYIRELRLKKAKKLLENQLLSIEDIAAEVGFSSAANFATSFKNHEGVTPRDYRKCCRK